MQSSPMPLPVVGPRSNEQVRVVVAVPFPIIQVGVRKILEDDFRMKVIGDVSTVLSLLETVIADPPDVALVDWSLVAQDLNATLALRRQEFQATALVFLTSSGEAQEKRAMLMLGARDVVNKRASASELRSALWRASQRSRLPQASSGGKAWAFAGAAGSTRDSEHRLKLLTRRERQIIPLVCGGLRNKAIAQSMGIAESTVWHHLTSIFTKLQVDDRMGLAAFAYGHGFISPDPQPDSGLQMGAD